MKKLAAIMLIIVGIIHLLPVSGVLGQEHLTALYGLSFDEVNITILMRHRAVLFGLLGGFLVFAAFRPAAQPLAFSAGFASVGSFLVLAHAGGSYNAAVARVVAADWIAVACLSVGAVAAVFASRTR
jgi:hypothetical protein